MASAFFSNVFDRRKSDVQTMQHSMVHVFIVAATLACSALLPPKALASNTPNLNTEVDFNVREQNVNDFLQALFQEINVPLAINAELDGNINGKFKDTAASVFSEIASAFDLVVYYDGAVGLDPAPVALDDEFIVAWGDSLVLDVLSNDTDNAALDACRFVQCKAG